MSPSTGLVLLWWLLPQFSSAIFRDGPCQPFREQPNQQEKLNFLKSINEGGEILLPVVITALDKLSYKTVPYKASFRTSYSFTATFNHERNCLDTFHLDFYGKNQPQSGFFINSTGIHAGNAFVEHDIDSIDWLVYMCQNVDDGQRKGHVAHLWILQRASMATKNSMKMSNLLRKYGDWIEKFGIDKRDLLGFTDNDYEFCDEYFRIETTAIWYRAVGVMLILIVLLTAVGSIAMTIFNASTKLRKVRKFSAQ